MALLRDGPKMDRRPQAAHMTSAKPTEPELCNT